MRAKPLLFAAFSVLLHSTGKTQTIKPEILTNKSIIDLHRAGLDDELIVAKIQSSECKFDLSTTGMIELKNKGVPSSLIRVMMNKAENKPLDTGADGKNITPDKKKGPADNLNYSALEMLNFVYTWNNSSHLAKALEKSTATVAHRVNVFTAYDYWHLDGPASNIRFSVTDATTFLINTGNSTPPDLVLYRLKLQKKDREAIYVKANMVGNKASPDMLSVNITKVADGIYQITPSEQLKKGEYFFTTRPSSVLLTSTEAFSFGIN